MTYDEVCFVSKLSNIRTRTIDNKDYYVTKLNVPKDMLKKLELSKDDDYVFARVSKAKWYHLVNWSNMNTTWEMMPQGLKDEIRQSGVEVPKELPRYGVAPTSVTGQEATKIAYGVTR